MRTTELLQLDLDHAADNCQWDTVIKMARSSYNIYYAGALMIAVAANQEDAVRALIDAQALSEDAGLLCIQETDNSILHEAILKNNPKILRLLLSDTVILKAQIELCVTHTNENGHTPIDLAAENGQWEIVKRIASKYPFKTHHASALVLAVKANQTDVVQALIASKFFKAMLPNDRYALFRDAILNNNIEIVNLLNRYMTNFMVQEALAQVDEEGRNLIQHAVLNGQWGIVKSLSKEISSYILHNDSHAFALLMAVNANQVDTVRSLIYNHALRFDELISSPSTGNSILHVGIENNHPEMLDLLLSEINTKQMKKALIHKNLMGLTPIELAAQKGLWDIVIRIITNEQIFAGKGVNYSQLIAEHQNYLVNSYYIMYLTQHNFLQAAIDHCEKLLALNSSAGILLLAHLYEEDSEALSNLLIPLSNKEKNPLKIGINLAAAGLFGTLHQSIDAQFFSIAYGLAPSSNGEIQQADALGRLKNENQTRYHQLIQLLNYDPMAKARIQHILSSKSIPIPSIPSEDSDDSPSEPLEGAIPADFSKEGLDELSSPR